MKLTLKLYASLGEYLPQGAKDNIIELEIEPEASAGSIIKKVGIPEESAHLVLVNGVYLDPQQRDTNSFSEGDVLAIWPPVAGG